MVHTSSDFEWTQRSRILNSCLLIIGLALGAVALASLGTNLGSDPLAEVSLPLALAFVLAGGWLLAAYLLSRMRRYLAAGSLVVAFALAVLATVIYLLPAYLTALLPFAAIPIALAALLLHHLAVYSAALATPATLFGAHALAAQFPPTSRALALPPESPLLTTGLAIAALCLLALILAPLRHELARMLQQIRRHEAAHSSAEQQQLSAEQAQQSITDALTRQAAQLEALLQQIGDGVIAINSAGKVVRANATASSIWAEVIGGDLIGQRFEQLRNALMGPAATTQFIDIVELPATASQGDEGYTHVLLDRRERARLTRLRGELLSLLADEMRNPLTSMVTALEMTLGQNLPEGADRVLVGARRSGQRLLELITTMLEIHPIEHNPNVLRRAPVPLRPILDAGITQTAPLQHQGAVQVVVEYSGDGVVLVDSERVRRAFVHLLEHALRQSPPYSTVQVRTESQPDAILVRISDQGPGMTTQQRELLFEQRSAPDERKAPALGLAFSKLVLETHGGRVLVESSGSHGSTYAFTLPLERH